MVDVFGSSSRHQGKQGRLGPVGATGPPGQGLSDYFFGKQLSKSFYENLAFSCFFNDKKSGLIFEKEKVVALKNQVGKNNAVAINKFENLIKIPDYGYGVEMTKSKYMINEIDWARAQNTTAIFFFAFKINAFPKEGETEFLFYTEYGDRGIFLKGTNLRIKACEKPEHHYLIPYKQREWNICYIEFNNCSDLKSRYKINDLEGTFITEKSIDPNMQIFIGGKENSYFKGVLARFDLYTNFAEENQKVENLPIGVRNAFLREHYVIDEDGLDKKKMKL